MRLHTEGGEVTVVLSRRNLLSLLHKLDMPGSARTLVASMPDGLRLTAKCEDDAEHYWDRDPGPVHPDTEAFLGVGRSHLATHTVEAYGTEYEVANVAPTPHEPGRFDADFRVLGEVEWNGVGNFPTINKLRKIQRLP